nr:headcase protein homolog isoform X1 [Hydra vulgaris]
MFLIFSTLQLKNKVFAHQTLCSLSDESAVRREGVWLAQETGKVYITQHNLKWQKFAPDMSRVNVQTIEEKFMFGSPPLLNGFSSYCSCRFEDNYSTYYGGSNDSASDKKPLASNKPDYDFSSNINDTMNSFNQLSVTDRFVNSSKVFENAGKNFSIRSSVPLFPKRKDLNVLQRNLSKERFRQVKLRLEDWSDEDAKEIITSVHKTMNQWNLSHVMCMFCDTQSQVYESFPVVDGTLFLTPIKLSHDKCIKFVKKKLTDYLNYMCYICIDCLEGYSKVIKCVHCAIPWNGSFFQIGTLYNYDILSAIPCCNWQLSCKNCNKMIIDNAGSKSLFFSQFSKQIICPHCNVEDFHFIKPLSMFKAFKEKD